MTNKIQESARPCRQAKRYKLALLTFVGLLAPVYFIPPLLTTLLGGSRFLTVSVAVALIVMLMSYVIMPLLMRIAARWLFPAARTDSEDKDGRIQE